jgi:hypothetical protein
LDAELVNIALNGFTKAWEQFIRASTPKSIFPSGRDFGMTPSRRLIESLDPTSREEVEETKTQPLSAKQRKAEGKFLSRRVTVMERGNNLGRRET